MGAIVVLTEWDEFKQYPYDKFYAKMLKPAFLFDGRGILQHSALEEIGFEVHAIGKGRGPDGRLRILAACSDASARGGSPRKRGQPCMLDHSFLGLYLWSLAIIEF